MLLRLALRSLFPMGGSAWLVLAAATGCAGESPSDGGLGGAGGAAPSDDRYLIQDLQEDCDDVAGLRGAAIVEAAGLSFEGDLAWSDLETGEEASRSLVHVEANIADVGTFTCIPFRQLPGEPAQYARLSYDGASLSMVTEDGLLDESGPAVVWLSETSTADVLTLEIVMAFPVSEVSGSFEVSPILGESYENLVLVYSPSTTMPLGHVSVASEPLPRVLEDGDVSAGVSHGYFPAFP